MNDMMEKAKGFLKIATFLTTLLYAAGYMAEYAHTRMLGIPAAEPLAIKHLVTGGKVLLETLFALYATLITHVYYIIPVVIIIILYIRFERPARKKNSPRMPKTYVAVILPFILVLLVYWLPRFVTPFLITDLLVPGPKSYETVSHNEELTDEIRHSILHAGQDIVKMKHLTDIYATQVLLSMLSALVLVSMVGWWKRWKPKQRGAPGEQRWWTRVVGYLRGYKKSGYVLLVLLMILAVSVQAALIPINYGILIHSNYYPKVKITPAPNARLSEDLDFSEKSAFWLLRESGEDVLLYGIMVSKDDDFPDYKVFTLKKEHIQAIEIRTPSSIFEKK